MKIGFVYVLLNPSFPKYVKIGLTGRDTKHRARELSSTSVPEDFIVIYDELVSDAERVEAILHERFADYRVNKRREFFSIPPRDAVKALMEVAREYEVPPSTPRFEVDFYDYFKNRFSDYLDPNVVGIRVVQLPQATMLEVTRNLHGKNVTEQDGIPLWGLEWPPVPTQAVLEANVELLKSLTEYDWIMVSSLIPPEKAKKIADTWEKPGGTLEALGKRPKSKEPQSKS